GRKTARGTRVRRGESAADHLSRNSVVGRSAERGVQCGGDGGGTRSPATSSRPRQGCGSNPAARAGNDRSAGGTLGSGCCGAGRTCFDQDRAGLRGLMLSVTSRELLP